MPHINVEPGQHDPTASAFIVRLDTPEPALMLHMHRLLNKWLQFGGHVEKHENPWDAVVHEIAEESGYEINQLQLLQPKVRIKQQTDAHLHPVPIQVFTHKFEHLDHYHSDISFAFTATGEPHSAVRAGESEKIVLFTVSELRALPADSIPENVRIAGLFVLEECLREWEQVPARQFSQ